MKITETMTLGEFLKQGYTAKDLERFQEAQSDKKYVDAIVRDVLAYFEHKEPDVFSHFDPGAKELLKNSMAQVFINSTGAALKKINTKEPDAAKELRDILKHI